MSVCCLCVLIVSIFKVWPERLFGVSADKSLSWSVASSIEFCYYYSPHAVCIFARVLW